MEQGQGGAAVVSVGGRGGPGGSGPVWNAGLRTGSWAKHSRAGSETGVPTSRQTGPPPSRAATSRSSAPSARTSAFRSPSSPCNPLSCPSRSLSIPSRSLSSPARSPSSAFRSRARSPRGRAGTGAAIFSPSRVISAAARSSSGGSAARDGRVHRLEGFVSQPQAPDGDPKGLALARKGLAGGFSGMFSRRAHPVADFGTVVA